MKSYYLSSGGVDTYGNTDNDTDSPTDTSGLGHVDMETDTGSSSDMDSDTDSEEEGETSDDGCSRILLDTSNGNNASLLRILFYFNREESENLVMVESSNSYAALQNL